MNKKAFTLIEIILALIVASIISVQVFNTMSNNSFNESVIKLQKTIKYIINDGIISPIGYASSRGGDCSDELDFTHLTTIRLANCMEYDNDDLELDTHNKLSGLDLMQNYGGCTVEVAVSPLNTIQFDVYVDCSELQVEDRLLQRVEEAISFTFQRELSDIFLSITENAISLNSAIGGDEFDAKVRGRFEL